MIKNTETINFLSYTAKKIGTPNVFISVGIPGSGKTTFMSEMADYLHIRRVSPDDIRETLAGDAADQSRNNEVWEIAHDQMRAELQAERSVIIDATYCQPEIRRQSTQIFRDWGAKALVAIIFNIPLDVAKERNAQRERHVQEFVIDRMFNNLQKSPPSFDDGFDILFTSVMEKSKPNGGIDFIHAETDID